MVEWFVWVQVIIAVLAGTAAIVAGFARVTYHNMTGGIVALSSATAGAPSSWASPVCQLQ